MNNERNTTNEKNCNNAKKTTSSNVKQDNNDKACGGKNSGKMTTDSYRATSRVGASNVKVFRDGGGSARMEDDEDIEE